MCIDTSNNVRLSKTSHIIYYYLRRQWYFGPIKQPIASRSQPLPSTVWHGCQPHWRLNLRLWQCTGAQKFNSLLLQPGRDACVEKGILLEHRMQQWIAIHGQQRLELRWSMHYKQPSVGGWKNGHCYHASFFLCFVQPIVKLQTNSRDTPFFQTP